VNEDEKKEWELLEKELLKYDLPDDETLLADISALLQDDRLTEDTEVEVPADDPVLPELEQELAEEKEDSLLARRAERRKKDTAAKERDDKWVIGLLITACFLCVGIIGVLIYWLENFLKF